MVTNALPEAAVTQLCRYIVTARVSVRVQS